MQSWQFSNDRPSRSLNRSEGGESPLAALCLQIVDFGLISIIFVAPLFFGGRHTLGRAVFIGLVTITAIAWFIRQATIRQAALPRTWAYLIASAAIALVAIQIIPLPSSWIQQLAPRNSELIPLWSGESSLSLGTWQTISLTPNATSMALATLVAYVLLFVTVVGRLQTEADIQRLLRLLAIAAILMSGFGLIQLFTSNGRFFWFYEYPYTSTKGVAKGSFSCRNHFADFLALGFAPLLAWTVTLLQKHNSPTNRINSSDNKVMLALYAGLFLVAIAVFMSMSRGGAIALAVVSTTTIAIYYRRGLISGTYLYGLGVLVLLIMGGLSIYGTEQISNRLQSLTSGSVEKIDNNAGRRKIWNANLAAISEGGLLGSGAGSHREIYPVYLPESLEVEYTHAECGYLQIATENGAIGATLLGFTILMVLGWCWRAVRNAASTNSLILAGAVTASLLASLVHSLVDFVWFIPACMSITILLAACALRLAQISTGNESSTTCHTSHSRFRWGSTAVLASLAAVWAFSVVLKPAWASTQWDRYLISASELKKQTARSLSLIHKPADNEEQQLVIIQDCIIQLQQVLAKNPDSPRANLRLARKYLQLFDFRQRNSNNAMSVDQIRDAAMSSQFASAESLKEWLSTAFGENSTLLYKAYYHTRRALKLCPLQGEGYLFLANLCFLEGRPAESIDAYLSQGLQVRPHDGGVLFEVGKQKLLQGRGEEAIAHWQKIFNDSGVHQLQIVQLLAGRIPAALFIETFQPDWKTIRSIWHRYRQTGSEEDWLHVLKCGVAAAEKETESSRPDVAANNWCRLAVMQKELEQYSQALVSLHRAHKISPSHYWARRELGKTLLQTEQYNQAATHLRWCYGRRPNDTALKNELLKAHKLSNTQTANSDRSLHK